MGDLRSGSIRLGILGTGRMARLFASAARSVPEISLYSVASRSIENARVFARDFGISQAHEQASHLFSDDRVDLVYVCTPPAFHAEHAKACLMQGKAVLVEKPFTVSSTEAEEVIAIARSRKLFCMEAMWMRFLPGFQYLMKIIRDGQLGQVRFLSADFGVPASFPTGSHHWNSTQGGAWLDRGIYGLSLANALFGTSVSVTSKAILNDSGCDLQSSAILEFGNGALASVSASFIAYSGNEAVIAGENGRIRIKEPFLRPEVISLKSAPLDISNSRNSKQSLKSRLAQSTFARQLRSFLPHRDTFIAYQGNGYVHELQEAVRCIRQSRVESDIMPWEQTLQVMQDSDKVRAHWVKSQ